MHKITFFPLGNADTCLIELERGGMLLFDYANLNDPQDESDKRIDLSSHLRNKLDPLKRDSFDVVAFTHADDDHIHGASDFFFLEHAAKYQSKERIRIDELWVPAGMILEEGLKGEAAVLRAEARHRLKKGSGIRVFSRPEKLADWLKNEGIELKDRLNVISNAGTLIPGYTKEQNGVEFFVHSPFSKDVDGEVQDRNEAALILHLTFLVDDTESRFFLIGDTTHEILEEIVAITKAQNRQERLSWDIYDIPHHCSYLALSDEKGKDITEPSTEIAWLLHQGANACLLVSCSDPIPVGDTTAPPHKQAASYYRSVADQKKGEFVVTMEFPKRDKPEPLVVMLDNKGLTVLRKLATPAIIASHQRAPRAG